MTHIDPSLAPQPNAPYHSEFAQSSVVWEGTIAGLLIEGTPVSMQAPTQLPARPAYMPDLRNTTATKQLTLDFETQGGPFKPGAPFPVMQINKQSFR